jgi:hypothetical protein
MVKLEFFVVSAGALASYRCTHQVPRSSGTIAITTPVPVPELVSAWADKIKAVATRDDFKWRDAYDLWWIARCFRDEGAASNEARVVALRVTASLYGKTLRDVAAGLSRVIDSGILSDIAAFEADMKRWFVHDVFTRYRAAGLFREACVVASREIESALALIGAATP